MSFQLSLGGKEAILSYIQSQSLWLAWGIGDPAWDTGGTPDFNNDATALVAELGRHRVDNKQFVVPDDVGTIVVNGQHYSLTVGGAPSSWLYVAVTFENTLETTASIREAAMFMNPTFVPSVTPNYHEVGDVITPGTLLFGENFAKIIRSVANQEKFYYVISL